VAARLVKPADVAVNLQYFLKMEADSGVKLSFKSPPPTRALKGSYIAVPYSLDVQGTFKQAMTFVRKLETGDRFCRVLRATLRRDTGENTNSTKSTDLIRVSLTIELLGQP
jgi:hypothetical protein